MSRLDVTRLINDVKKDGKTVARCPACAARGGDVKGNNLVVFADGKFGCAAFAKDKEHNRAIFDLVGVKTAGNLVGSVPVHRIQHLPTQVIKVVGRLGRSSSSASPIVAQPDALAAGASRPASQKSESSPKCPVTHSNGVVSGDTAATPEPKMRSRVPFMEILESKGYNRMEDGRVVDPSRLDDAGNPVVVARHGISAA